MVSHDAAGEKVGRDAETECSVPERGFDVAELRSVAGECAHPEPMSAGFQRDFRTAAPDKTGEAARFSHDPPGRVVEPGSAVFGVGQLQKQN